MNGKDENIDDYRSLLLLDEISRDHALTQRDLSRRLGVALGLVNSYLKNLASKGYITVSAIPKRRYTYYLTPSGLSEKTRLTLKHIQNFTSLYRLARRDFRELFMGLSAAGFKRIALLGTGEVTEIAYLSLKEAGLELSAIFDSPAGGSFLGMEVKPVASAGQYAFDAAVMAPFGMDSELKAGLEASGIDRKRIFSISPEGWLKRMEP